ncbi:hypothetical protein HYV89_02210 [Candidatus Woesearchaeota archaeon]|nr:hypothetical protein [Candidatus Woesearchaeota archaeon]
MTVTNTLKLIGKIGLDAILYPTKTTIIERESGDVVRRYNAWNEFLREENNYPYSEYKYIIVRGLDVVD